MGLFKVTVCYLMKVSQEQFEKMLMNLLLEGDQPVLAVLRQQYLAAKVGRREFTGVGFWSDFEIPESAPLVEPPNFAAGTVDIQLEGVRLGAGCVLFIKNSKLVQLDCYTYDDDWPEDINIKSLRLIEPALPK
jgi:hypothetical protein